MIHIRNVLELKGGPIPEATGYYVGRPTALGNPFSHLKESTALWKVETRDEAVENCYEWIKSEIQKDGEVTESLLHLCKVYYLYGELTLYCWCVPKRCHAEAIAYIIENAVSQVKKSEVYRLLNIYNW